MVEETLLIFRFKRGSPQALRQIYDRHKVEMLKLVTVLLAEALQQLPYEQREVICLRMEMDMSFHQIATIQKVPSNTAKGRYRYGMERLRSLMNGKVRRCDPQTA